MSILIRKAVIVDPDSPFHRSSKDIFIQDGIIRKIADEISDPADQVIEHESVHLSPGWVDIFTHCCDPGYEYRETLETGARAAALGGFTHIFVVPNTKPVVHDKSMVTYIAEKQVSVPVSLHPLGAITRDAQGKELAEMYDMHAGGAIAFSDGWNTVQSAGLMIKALQYIRTFDGIILQIPDDKSIAPHGLMNEGVISTRLGLPGKPAMAEELMVARDIKLARYTGSRLHFTGVTTARSLEYIRRAKSSGVDITCSVTPQHMYFTDVDLQGYDTNLKTEPPIRGKEDAEALKNAVLDGTIDCISSHHQPQAWDQKVCEFEYAKPGMTGLQTLFGVAGALGIPFEQIIRNISLNPRKIFRLPAATIVEGEIADITLFNPEIRYSIEQKDLVSKSINTPFIGKTLTGKVLGIIHKNKILLQF